MAVFFTNESTDTQGGIWWRKSTKEVRKRGRRAGRKGARL
jgi:hypothetical protein